MQIYQSLYRGGNLRVASKGPQNFFILSKVMSKQLLMPNATVFIES